MTFKIFIYIVALLLAVLSVFQMRKVYKIPIIILISILIIFLMANFSLRNWDNFNYYYNYYILSQGWVSKSETGFVLMNNLAVFFKLDYLGFRYLYFGLFFSALIYIANKLTDNLGFFLIGYLLYPVFKDAEQIRMFGATVFLFIGLYYLCLPKPKYFLFIIYNILAGLFHSSVFIFLILLFLKLPSKFKNKLYKYSIFFIILLVLITLLNRNLINSIVQPFISFIYSEKGQNYSETSSRFGFVFPLLLFIANYLLIFYSFNTFENRYRVNKEKFLENKALQNIKNLINIQELFNITYLLSFIPIFALPLIMMNLHFYRIGKVTFVFSLVYYSTILKRLNNNAKFFVVTSLLMIVMGYYIFDFIIFGTFEANYLTLFLED